MKEFNFIHRNPMASVNHLLATDIPYLTVNDIYPNDHNVAQAIADFACSFDAAARVINNFTYSQLRKTFGRVYAEEEIKINDEKFYVVKAIYQAKPVYVNGERKFKQSNFSPLKQIDYLNIPQFVPKK